MNPDPSSLPDHLDLDLPFGPVLASPHPPLSPEALAAWRRRCYLLAIQKDPGLPTRWIPKTIPFDLD
jgi:hypothetical protein